MAEFYPNETADQFRVRSGGPDRPVESDPWGNGLLDLVSGEGASLLRPVYGTAADLVTAGGRAAKAFTDSNGLSNYFAAASKAAESLGSSAGKVGIHKIEAGGGPAAARAAASLAESAKTPLSARAQAALKAFQNPTWQPSQATEAAVARRLRGVKIPPAVQDSPTVLHMTGQVQAGTPTSLTFTPTRAHHVAKQLGVEPNADMFSQLADGIRQLGSPAAAPPVPPVPRVP